MRNSTDRQILRIAVPSIVSNITVPLLGIVDVAITGHLGAASYIGAIAVGGMLFNIIYWIFGFLRMGTSGMTSQAYGRGDTDETVRLLLRSLGTGLVVAFALIALQRPIQALAFTLIQADAEVERLARLYFRLCIWGAPAVLGLYGFSGWCIGMQDSKSPMWIAIGQNLVNIAASLFLVCGLRWKIEGVAAGTLTAQYAGAFMAYLLWKRRYRTKGRRIDWRSLPDGKALSRFFGVNRDIFLRTLCLEAVTLFFTSAGAAQGQIVLAVNTLLMQLFTLFSYVMDGFAYAGEALAGRCTGAGDTEELRRTAHRLFVWGAGLAAAFTLLYGTGGPPFLRLLTDEADVLREAGSYYGWAAVIPMASFAAFLFDGIFIGTTATRQMLLSMLVAAAGFFLLYYGLEPRYGNHALWTAFIAYLSLRGIVQGCLWKRFLRHRQG